LSLALVAMRAGEKILWDGKAMKGATSPQSHRFLKESYPSGWEISS
jgi:hypothetical protein